MSYPEFQDLEIYPAMMSAGGINAYTMSNCEIVGFQSGYCICVNKILAFEREGTLRGLEECERAISNKVCPALPMWAKEKAAGQAIFFINRKKLQAHNQEREAFEAKRLEDMLLAEKRGSKSKPMRPAGDFVGLKGDHKLPPYVAKTEPVKSEPVVSKSSVIDSIDTASYATVITAVAEKAPPAEPPVAPAPKVEVMAAVVPVVPQPPKPAPKIEAQKGESLLAMARRMMANK